MVKPNLAELQSLAGRTLATRADQLAGFLRQAHVAGVHVVALTLGVEGALVSVNRIGGAIVWESNSTGDSIRQRRGIR